MTEDGKVAHDRNQTLTRFLSSQLHCTKYENKTTHWASTTDVASGGGAMVDDE